MANWGSFPVKGFAKSIADKNCSEANHRIAVRNRAVCFNVYRKVTHLPHHPVEAEDCRR